MLENIIAIDQNILLWIQEIRNDTLTSIFILITKLGDFGLIWILISLGLLATTKMRKVGVMSLCSLGVAYIINNIIIKNLVERIRPYEIVSGLERLISIQRDFSFPSGHTGSSFAAATVLALCLSKKHGIIAIAFAVLIGFSRLYLGVHYPTDVLAGAIIGVLIGNFIYIVGMQIINRKKDFQNREKE